MNLVLDEAEEVNIKTKTRKQIGRMMLNLFEFYLDKPFSTLMACLRECIYTI